MNRNFARALMGGALLTSMAASASAVVAFSNFGPGYSYNPNVGWTVAGPGFGTEQTVATQFTSAASGLLSNIKIALEHVGGPNVAQVTLYEDSGSDTLGNWLITWWGDWGWRHFGDNAGPTTLPNQFTVPTLTQGVKYWVEARYNAQDSWHAWNYNSIGDVRRTGFSHDNGATYFYSDETAPTFEINLVPEPASLAVLGLGALALIRRRR